MNSRNNNIWLKTWYEHLSENSNKISLVDMNKEYSRQEVEVLSGKIYRYLKENGIGKNDFVMIDMHRSSMILIAMLGVTKAGAAYVVAESELGNERKLFIQMNTQCKTVLDESLINEIEKGEYLKGYEAVDMHDAAFGIYTSGTTGNPKGIVHEFGNFIMLRKSIADPETGILRENSLTRFLNIAPFNFVASVMIYVLWLFSGGTVYTPDYSVIKNIKRLAEYMLLNRINQTFMSPSLLKLMSNKLNPEMELIYTGSEPANDISIPQVEVHNLYLMSETGFVLCQYQISEPMSLVPVGKPNLGITLSLTEDGEVICYNPYCRGYINPEDGNFFVDGYYHTGDIAELDTEGEYIIKGRNTDMIKIDGNRIEPMEVELAVKKVLNNIECAVKGFETDNETTICLYYVSDETIDKIALSERLSDILPYYMIPKHFVKMDVLPKTAMGKLDRKELKAPAKELKDIPYVAPENETERRFCKAFEKVMNIDKIGVDTDLFDIGLTSINAIEAVTELNLDEVNANDIYQTRTIRKLVQRFLENQKIYLSPEEKEMEGRKHLYPLYPQVSLMYLGNKYSPETTSLNLSGAYRFNKIVDVERLKLVLNNYMDQSSTFKVRLIEDNEGTPFFKYAPEMYHPVEIETMEETEVEELAKTFVQPFNLLKELPYRIRLIKTRKYAYLFIDMHHVITDGAGMVSLGENLVKAYLGKPTDENNFFAYCYDVKKEMGSDRFKQKIEYTRDKYLGKDWGLMPRRSNGEVYCVRVEYDSGITVRSISKYTTSNMISRNTLFDSALHLVHAKLNKKNNNIINWGYSNREQNGNQAGLLARGMFHGVYLSKKMSLKGLYNEIDKEIQDGIATNITGIVIPEIESSSYLVIDDLGDIEKPHNYLAMVGKPVELARPKDMVEGQGASYSALNFINRDDKLILRLDTDNSWMDEDFRNEFLHEFSDVLKRLISNDETVITDYVN